ncbi:MAG: twin-arginine translocase TatA/TatE family subunit [Thermodesulfobacteriota bacterium]
MLGGLGIWELLLILLIVLIIFGAGKLPEIGAGLGRGISNFRKTTQEGKEIDVTAASKSEAKAEKDKIDKPST